MNTVEDPGGRSGIFPRIEISTPPPPQADAPAPARPLPARPRSQDGDLPLAPESEDTARYADLDPADSEPDAEG